MSEVLIIAKKFIKELSRQGYLVNQAFLFGSYAKGNPKSYSDIDVCVVSPKLGKDFVSETVKLMGISQKVDMRIEPIPFSPERLNDPFDPLAAEVRKYGISVL